MSRDNDNRNALIAAYISFTSLEKRIDLFTRAGRQANRVVAESSAILHVNNEAPLKPQITQISKGLVRFGFDLSDPSFGFAGPFFGFADPALHLTDSCA